jgi:hypothetical protein
LRRTLRAWQPYVVGFGCYSNQARLRELPGLIPTGVAARRSWWRGACSIAPQDLNRLNVRFRGGGEGSVAIRRLLAALEAGGPSPTRATCRSGSPNSPRWRRGPAPAHQTTASGQTAAGLVDRSKYFCIWSGKPTKNCPLYPRVAHAHSVGYRGVQLLLVQFPAHGRYSSGSPPTRGRDRVDFGRLLLFLDDEMFINPCARKAIARLLIERGIRKQYVSWARSARSARSSWFKLWQRAAAGRLRRARIDGADALKGFNKGVDRTRTAGLAILREAGIVLHSR